MTAATVDAARLGRGLHLDAIEQAPGRWLVTGGAAPHVVTLDAGGARCDCADAQYRRVTCSHVLAVRLHCGDPSTLRALRVLVPLKVRSRPRRASTASVACIGLAG